jgi:hypothetical protein
MTMPVDLRDVGVISAESAALHIAAEKGSSFHEGARDALRWLLVGGPGPLTGAISDLPISFRAVVAELATAEALIYGEPSARSDYAMGLEHALMWAERATKAAPSAARRPERAVRQ